MRLNDEQRSAVSAAMAEAHDAAKRPDGSVAVRAVPVHFLRILRDVQLALEGMGLNDLRRHLAQAEKARNTSSRRIRLFTDLITVMEEEGVGTVGEALTILAGRAA